MPPLQGSVVYDLIQGRRDFVPLPLAITCHAFSVKRRLRIRHRAIASAYALPHGRATAPSRNRRRLIHSAKSPDSDKASSLTASLLSEDAGLAGTGAISNRPATYSANATNEM